MPVFVDPPPFPVIDPSPSLGRVVCAFRPSDWAIATALTTLGYAWGWKVGRMPWGGLFASVGILGGFNIGYVRSFSRLLGYERNEVELDKYGYWRPPPLSPPPPPAHPNAIDTKY